MPRVLCVSPVHKGPWWLGVARLRPYHFPFSSHAAPSAGAPGWGVYATVAVGVGAFRE